jgi:transposase-like protein
MAQFQPVSQSIQPIIETPKCPRCRARTTLARIEPAKAGYDRRTFECTECHHEITNTVKFG